LKAVECVRLGTESEIEQAIGEVEAACERVLEGNPSTDCRLDTFGLRLGKIAEYVLEKWAPGARSLYEINQELPACPQFEPGG